MNQELFLLRRIRYSVVVRILLKHLHLFLLAVTAYVPTDCLKEMMTQRVSCELHGDDRNICPMEGNREEMPERGEKIVVTTAIR